MSYLKVHIFVPFHCFVQIFLPRKYSAVSSLVLDYTALLYIFNELPLCSQYLFVTIFTMVFSKEDKIIIQNNYEEKGWSAYRKDHSSKNWTYTSVKKNLKRFKDSGTMNRKEGSGRRRSVTTEKNTDLIEELICSQ